MNVLHSDGVNISNKTKKKIRQKSPVKAHHETTNKNTIIGQRASCNKFGVNSRILGEK